ncbi:YbgA family protein [Vibrio casei]|uniref:DUF1722 domain-containing protein n=1 Tax=Vibrio casei TaxID=673372 RepID=A0A368LNZ6_9VIBR|nr:DUF523 and DUF1722 domain-containing protein [Vibrio casei]RCS73629.1 DUF1722 domain-containing protein [Vibrio casei]SJN16729.1 Hypothetical protein YbgA [Vibrio casei]
MKLPDKKPYIGISACVAGLNVRFDKGHKKSDFCMTHLAPFVEYQTYCPEVAIGLPTPRPTIRQVQLEDGIHVSRPDGNGDVTQSLTEYGQNIAQQIDHLSGFIFCQKSPSCGMERVKVYQADGKGSMPSGIGLFAKQIMAMNPNLPCEENGRLCDPALRENFMIRVFTYRHWQDMVNSGLTKHKLIQFHSERKYLLMSHHLISYKETGQLLAKADISLQEMAQQYIRLLMAGLKHVSTHKSHTNTLQHLQGYFKKVLTKEQKQELSSHITHFREGLVPLVVPLTLINHYLKEFPQQYLATQVYLSPYPKELKLRYI